MGLKMRFRLISKQHYSAVINAISFDSVAYAQSMGKSSRRISSFALIVLSILVLTPLYSTVGAAAVASWEEDGWLTNFIGEDRLNRGDEFGCYGFPTLSWQANSADVVTACRNYLLNHTSASRWNDNPVSLYTPSGLNYADHEVFSSLGFSVHGDNTGLENTAWHNGEDEPEWAEDWYNLGRRGGSLEAVIADLSSLKEEAAKGGLVNMYWIGRVGDATVRHDRDVEDWLVNSDAWFTTWGEAWSYWASQRCYEFEHNGSVESAEHGISFTYLRPYNCQAQDPRVWDVPITWKIDLNGSSVDAVVRGNVTLPQLEVVEHTLQEGWREEGGFLFLTIMPNQGVEIQTGSSTEGYDILPSIDTFNNASFAITIAGHATEDLFKWSGRFDDSELRFTWLITPRAVEDGLAWLPVVGVVVFVGSIVATFALIKKDKLKQLHPSQVQGTSKDPSQSQGTRLSPSPNEQSLDSSEE